MEASVINSAFDMVAIVIGYITIFGSIVMVFLLTFDFKFDKDIYMVEMFGFGILYARTEQIKTNMNTLYKTQNRKFFFKVPFRK